MTRSAGGHNGGTMPRAGRAVTDVARMLALVPWLLERPGVTVEETADSFGVSPTAIPRDLHHLDFCGLPGLGGGDLFEVDMIGDRIVVAMADELRRPLRPTPAEALRLVLTADGVAEILADELPALRSAVDKVRAALGIPAEVADVLADEPTEVLTALRDAVRDGVVVTFQYRGRADDQPRLRTVEPWQLLVDDGVWYLQARDVTADGARVFRIDRMHAVEATTRRRAQAVPTELPVPLFQPSVDAAEIIVELDDGAHWITDAVVCEEVMQVSGGGVEVRLLTDAPQWIAQLVMSAGGSARIRSPEWLRMRVHEQASRGLAAVE
ncbi:MAG: WYL domain-containing protein [Nitriliruptoraceae bacterium]